MPYATNGSAPPAPPSADDVLWGSGGAKTAEFKTPGTTLGGRVVSRPQSYHVREYDRLNPGQGPLAYYPSGDPIMGIKVDIQTSLREDDDDDGVRRLYLQSARQLAAVRDAVRATGAPGVQAGGVLTMTFTGTEQGDGSIPAKCWTAQYQPAGVAVPEAARPAPQETQAAQPPAWAQPPAAPDIAGPVTAPAAAPTITQAQAAAMRNAGIDTSVFTVSG